MVNSKDRLKAFIPDRPPKMILLGTMVAINARTLNDTPPAAPHFYYNNSRNHFWRVLQHLFLPEKKVVKNLSIEEKKAFLNNQRIGIQNIVSEIEVPNTEAHDPSDSVLFKAYKKNRLVFKDVDSKSKHYLEKTPLFFTCRYKAGIKNLVHGFKDHNSLNSQMLENIWYLPTPTRCNPKDRSEVWKKEIRAFLKERQFPEL